MLDCVLDGLCKILKTRRGVLPRSLVLSSVVTCLATLSGTALAQQGTFVPTENFVAGGTTATLLQNGMVLTTGPVAGLNTAALYNPTTETFTATGGSTVPNGGTTATLLNNGMVLIAVQNGFTAALYNPATGTFANTGDLNKGRVGAAATLLNNGKVLIAGGIFSCNIGNVCPAPSAELYDPTSGTFTLTGNPLYAHGNGTATLLNSGMVLLTGGEPQGPTNTVNLQFTELYNPATGTFIGTGHLNTGRVRHTATLLNNGQILIAGGAGSNTSAELYDPTTDAFTFTGSMNTARSGHTATLLSNGQVLVAGGIDSLGNSLISAELYDPTTGAFTPTGSLNDAGDGQTATLLNNGTVLLVGTRAELYELVAFLPTSLSFSNQLINVKSAPQSVTLTNNQSTALGVTSIAISGPNAPDFAETNNCPASVLAGASCAFSVSFTPTAAGSRPGSLAIATTLLTGRPLAVPLSGTGVLPAPIVSLSANGVAFAAQALGTTSAAQTVTVRNTGTATLSIQTVAITGANSGDFAIANGSTCTNAANVAINGSCAIQLTFTPTGPGARSATVGITDNAADSPETISLSGTTAPSVSVAPATVTFSSQYVGTSGLPQTVTLTNTGTASVNVTAVTTSVADFGVLSNCGNPVAVSASCTIGVFFDPTAGGTRTGMLTITDNAGNSPQTVALTGSGLDFSMTPGSASSATVSAGQTASYTIAVAPAGGFAASVALSCSGGPAGSACVVSPSTMALSGAAAQTAMVTVKTAANGWLLPFRGGWPRDTRYRQRPMILTLAAMFLLMVAASQFLRREQNLAWIRVVGFAALVTLGLTLTSCGGGSGSGGGGTNPQAGTYTVTVTGNFASGATTLNHSTKLTLVVQ
jgi:hypothetical protein